jgi:hypothetical protein
MVRVGSGSESHFASPMEVEGTASGGVFVAPLESDGSLFDAYTFQFSIYLGDGEFRKYGSQKARFNGVAAGMQLKGRDHILLTFEPLRSGPRSPSDCPPSLPHLLAQDDNDSVYFPLFRKVPKQRALKYSGKFVHKDFSHPFVEIAPVDPQVLDEILLEHGISLIGCDPHTEYHVRLPQERQESA